MCPLLRLLRIVAFYVECLRLQMVLWSGHRLAPYETLAAIRASGAGEVHGARGTHLDHVVAAGDFRPDAKRDPTRRLVRGVGRSPRGAPAIRRPA